MSGRFTSMILFTAAALILAACQQQSKEPAQEQTPQAQGEAPASAAPAMTVKPEAPAPAMTAKPAMTPKPSTPPAEASSAPAMTAKPAATAAGAPKPKAAPAMTPKPETSASKPEAMSTTAFNTGKCATCHSIDHDKVGPAWKTVAEKYGDEATLAKDFETGFKERRVANSIAKWKPKEGLMTGQFNNLIRGHEKEAAHALFESVKNGKFGNY
jgi:cytochrome c551/c552